MTKKIVIVGSASLQEKIQYWKSFWEQKGCHVINYTIAIEKKSFLEDYPKIHKDFF